MNITVITAAALATLTFSGCSTLSPSASPLLQRYTIVDLALQLDGEAIAALRASHDTDVPGRLTIGATSAGRAPDVVDVEVHIKGQLGSKRPIDDKPALKIKAAKDGRVHGLERLTLNNMVQDETMLHEALGYHVYAAAGVYVPDTSYVRLTVNGEPYGLYLHVETIDRAFLRRRFGDDTGILYEAAYGADLRAGDEQKFELHEGQDPGRAALKKLIAAVAAPGDGVFYGEGAAIDTPSFLAMMAVEPLITDWDNYYKANNYRIYWEPSRQRWFFIPTGLDQTFTDQETEVFGASGLLFQKCLASERCTVDYVAAVREAAGAFERAELPSVIDRLLASIDGASQADPRKPYSVAQMKASRETLRTFVATRAEIVRSALSCLDGGREKSFAACAGAVMFDAARERCVEIASRHPAQNGHGVRQTKCTGGVKQRWRLPAAGGGTDTREDFAIQPVGSDHCLEVDSNRDSELRQNPCTGAPAQRFRRLADAGDEVRVASVVDPQRVWTVARSILK